MYETIRIVGKLKPKYVIWENVKNLLSEKHKHNFDKYLQALEDLGYTNFYQVLNAKDYGLPQHRERIFTVSILNGDEFKFPTGQNLNIRLRDFLESEVDTKYYLNETKTNEFLSNLKPPIVTDKNDEIIVMRIGGIFDTEKSRHQAGSVYNINGLSPTLDTMQGGWRHPCIYKNGRVRRLTPKECWLLMGFDIEDFNKASTINSDSQLYKQAGNSIAVNVLTKILEVLLNE